MSKYFIITFILGAFYILSTSSSVNIYPNNTKNWMIDNYTKLQSSLEKMVHSIEEDESDQAIKNYYKQVQSDFRKIQFLLDYISEESVKRYINGAPLPSVEQSIPTVNVLDPRGLQVIDETLYEEGINKKVLLVLSKDLSIALHNLKSVFASADLYEADVKRAIYKDIIRIYTLQLTGFDTPGSLSGIENAFHNLMGINELLTLSFNENKNAKGVASLCKKAAEYLTQNKDFNTFDRVYYYKNHISSILKELSQWKTNDLPILSRNVNEKISINFESEHLFSTSLFKVDYFTLLPEEVALDQKVIALGKKLFYDPILSHEGKMSCATCHRPEKAFTDGLTTSVTNLEGLMGFRNTPTLINAVFTKGYFYDLREDDPSRQIVHVVKDKNEFNSDFIDIMDRLEVQDVYKKSFREAFPDIKISKYTITAAITAYVNSLTSFDSPFDKYMRGETTTIDPKVTRGFNLFAGKAACATCHFIPTFSGLVPATFKESESEVLGVPSIWNATDMMTLDTDAGRARSGKPRDEAAHLMFSFKTSTIRNISETAPYMHNGAFKSLEDVMDFYNKGGGIGLGFPLEYQTLSSDPLELDKNEISDIISFMNSLTSIPQNY